MCVFLYRSLYWCVNTVPVSVSMCLGIYSGALRTSCFSLYINISGMWIDKHRGSPTYYHASVCWDRSVEDCFLQRRSECRSQVDLLQGNSGDWVVKNVFTLFREVNSFLSCCNPCLSSRRIVLSYTLSTCTYTRDREGDAQFERDQNREKEKWEREREKEDEKKAWEERTKRSFFVSSSKREREGEKEERRERTRDREVTTDERDRSGKRGDTRVNICDITLSWFSRRKDKHLI